MTIPVFITISKNKPCLKTYTTGVCPDGPDGPDLNHDQLWHVCRSSVCNTCPWGSSSDCLIICRLMMQGNSNTKTTSKSHTDFPYPYAFMQHLDCLENAASFYLMAVQKNKLNGRFSAKKSETHGFYGFGSSNELYVYSNHSIPTIFL